METQEIKLKMASFDNNHGTKSVELVEDVIRAWKEALFENKLPSFLVCQEMIEDLYQSLYKKQWDGQDKVELFNVARAIEQKYR